MRWVIRTENLTKYYAHHRGVEGLCLDVEAGEIFGFLGLPGAGKTTTTSLLLDLIHPTRGWASILGMDTQRYGAKIRKQVGYQPSQVLAYPHWTVGQLLQHRGKQNNYFDWDYARQLMDAFALHPERRVFQLSKIEKQKAKLIQAFVHGDKLLILDEPVSGMDEEAHQAFYHLVARARATGCTIFLTTDSLADVERVCDRVAILHHGQLLGIERGVRLRGRAIRKIELRFSTPVSLEAFSCIPNLKDITVEDNILRCTVHGDPDALIKTASQFRVCDIISQRSSLEELLAASFSCPN